MHTACVSTVALASSGGSIFVVGKNYRLQDIQLSKIIRGKYRPSELAVARGAFPGPPSLTHSRGPKAPLRSFAFVVEVSGASSLDQPSYPMDPARVPQAGPSNFCSGHPGVSRIAPNSTRVFCEAGRRAPAERKCRRHLQTKIGGEYRARTGDLLVANQALSQLS